MDYEKAYKEALERARAGKPMNDVFPELHESEDERIMEYLISFIELEKGVNLPPDDAEKILAYLEKQKEQKPAEWSLVAELKHHLATTPKEQLEKEWKELEPWGNIGPTVQEFLYGKKSEVDLEKELRNYNVPFNDCGWERLTHNTLKEIARHFYELGLNARKEK